MSDRAQVQAIAEELAESSTYSLQIADRRLDLSRKILKASPAMLNAIESLMGVTKLD